MDRMDFRLPGGVRRDPAVDAWVNARADGLQSIARDWFQVMRDRGDDVRELMHDGFPVSCVGDAPFAYVNAFRAHVNVGFFHGATLADPSGLLEGAGKFMRHVKLKPGVVTDTVALRRMIDDAYAGIKTRLAG